MIKETKYSYANIKGLINGNEYVYQVSIVDKAGQEGPKSDPILLIPQATAKGTPGTKPPTAPPEIDYDKEPTPGEATEDDTKTEPEEPDSEPIPPGEQETPLPPYDPVKEEIDETGKPYTPPPTYDEFPPIIKCDGCKFLKEMLACPEWSTYMGEWENLLKKVIPPAPNWDEVAQKIGNGVSQGVADAVRQGITDAIGNDPPPTESELESQIPASPELNASYPEAENLEPMDPFPDVTPSFDLENREEIKITDDSQPFNITDPTINSHQVRTVVKPGDSSNHTDGIKKPDKVNSKNPIPVPKKTDNNTSYPTPIPSGTSVTAPIPSG